MKTEPVPSHQHDFYESKTSLWIEAEYGEKFPTNLASHLALAALEDNRASMQSQQLLRRKGSSCLFFPSFFFCQIQGEKHSEGQDDGRWREEKETPTKNNLISEQRGIETSPLWNRTKNKSS